MGGGGGGETVVVRKQELARSFVQTLRQSHFNHEYQGRSPVNDANAIPSISLAHTNFTFVFNIMLYNINQNLFVTCIVIYICVPR